VLLGAFKKKYNAWCSGINMITIAKLS